ncbi:DNA-dependent helicase II [Achromatium sp. WMS2]|nr:DNA-dependent helicase II [Achromatium sp. WMS2]
MNIDQILGKLNKAQNQAVTAPLGNLLILAGAGSGKTRVLVHRIAWLVTQQQVQPHSIMAVTFTNKAARELRERLSALLDYSISDMWVGTFHGLAHKLLRIHWEQAKIPRDFQILDADDQLRLIKRVQLSLNLDPKAWPPRKTQWFINHKKDEGQRPQYLSAPEGDRYHATMLNIYQAYHDLCVSNGQLDFAELLLLAHETLRDNPPLLQHYQMRFKHLLVDEFQDTNTIQYAWLRLLAGGRECIFAVGDDDQAIYGWRGARVENIQSLQNDLSNTQLIRLEQNYRSTKAILEAANSLISYNNARLGKTLWTASTNEDSVEIYNAYNELNEAEFVVKNILDFSSKNPNLANIAILYRTSSQSQLFEEALLQAQIPYRVYGGVKFFERAEIKDALAYLRLVANPHDDISFERAAGIPPKGIGKRTIDLLKNHAMTEGSSLWQAVATIPSDILGKRAINALETFTKMLESLRNETQGLELFQTVAKIIETSKLPDYYGSLKDGTEIDRQDNLAELVNVSRRFAREYGTVSEVNLDIFLANSALEAEDTANPNTSNAVQLMTLHAAKGLEFPLVFIVGVEEGLFPHQMCFNSPNGIEEERRLCYVGITRAMQKLYLTHAKSRRIYGNEYSHIQPSRFIEEIKGVKGSKDAIPQFKHVPKYQDKNVSNLRIGRRVMHSKFGVGTILNLEGQGSSARAQVHFLRFGTKWLVIAYANLETLD